MPYLSHHFQTKDRPSEVPPWGIEPSENFGKDKNGKQLTTYGWLFQGKKGLAAQPYRNNTSNHFNPQNWREKSSYQETFRTPQKYSRHQFQHASVHRNHRPHPKEIVWPLEPNKGYMIWKPKLIPDENLKRTYTAPSLLRQYNESNWHTTNRTTYQNYFLDAANKSEQKQQKQARAQNNQREESQSQLSTRQMNTRNTNTRGQISQERQKKVHTTTPHLRTSYRSTYNGELSKPSTNAKPADLSWRHIKY